MAGPDPCPSHKRHLNNPGARESSRREKTAAGKILPARAPRSAYIVPRAHKPARARSGVGLDMEKPDLRDRLSAGRVSKSRPPGGDAELPTAAARQALHGRGMEQRQREVA